MKTIKAVYNRLYEIELKVDSDDMYHVIYSSVSQGLDNKEILTDYKMADYIFDMKLIELGGN